MLTFDDIRFFELKLIGAFSTEVLTFADIGGSGPMLALADTGVGVGGHDSSLIEKVFVLIKTHFYSSTLDKFNLNTLFSAFLSHTWTPYY